MHRFIIYQYGKVGSTSITETLNRQRDVEAYQSHFLGEAAFTEILGRLMTPEVPEYFFEHSVGQLAHNLRVNRLFLRRAIDAEPLTVISLAREPFDWFRSGMAQDIQQHLVSLQRMLDVREIAYANEEEAVEKGIGLLFHRLLQAIEHFGSVDEMCAGKRYPELRSSLEHADRQDFQQFMFFVNIFLRPHLWFQTHFSPVLGVNLQEMAAVDAGVFRREESWGNIYLLRYEQLEAAFPFVMADLGYASKVALPRKNRSSRKPFASVLQSCFSSGDATRLKARCHSRDTRYLGYT